MKAREIMTRDPRTVTPDTRLPEVARLMQSEDVGVIPVVDGSRNLVGVVTDRDIALRVVAEGRDPNATMARDVMSGDVRTCKEDDDVDDVMDVMGREQVRRIPIVDERGSLVGIVAQADIVLEGKSDRKSERTIEKISEPGR
ncbi:MAG TPA: CBS domain-containing protein [Gemmatimonadaceae bacterium]|nr:CBS domain-containing protein [Gemmatimonadaceae bacterium]